MFDLLEKILHMELYVLLNGIVVCTVGCKLCKPILFAVDDACSATSWSTGIGPKAICRLDSKIEGLTPYPGTLPQKLDDINVARSCG